MYRCTQPFATTIHDQTRQNELSYSSMLNEYIHNLSASDGLFASRILKLALVRLWLYHLSWLASYELHDFQGWNK